MVAIKRSWNVLLYISEDFTVYVQIYSKSLSIFIFRLYKKKPSALRKVIQACVNLSRPMLSLQLYSASSGLAGFPYCPTLS